MEDQSPSAGPSRPSSRQPWYRTAGTDGHKKMPYELSHVSIQEDDNPFRTCHYVSFWPFTSPVDAEISEGAWDDMEGVFAIAATERIMVGRVTDTKGFEDLWSYETGPQEPMLHVEWSYDPVTLRPILAAAGRSHVIHLFDYQRQAPYRVLRGHGHEIYCLKFHPHLPHILASASGDKTMRIWNVTGTELPPPKPGELRSQNYPQGKADEGNVIVAVLAGEFKGGHRSGVSTIAFHPRHNAIASGGFDRQVAIWRLPPLPGPTLKPVATTPGYRPEIVLGPLFSTDTIHTDKLASIDWLGPDVLISRSGSETVVWQWTSFSDYFDDDNGRQRDEMNHVPFGHKTHSQNYRICYDFQLPTETEWYRRFGIHHAFDPTEDEVDFGTSELVIDNLLAFPVRAKTPRLKLLNPHLLRPQPAPDPPNDYERPATPDYYGEIPEPKPDSPGDEGMPIEIDSDTDDVEPAGDGADITELERSGHSMDIGDDDDLQRRPASAASSPKAKSKINMLQTRKDLDKYDSSGTGIGQSASPTPDRHVESQVTVEGLDPPPSGPWTLKLSGYEWETLVEKVRQRRHGTGELKSWRELRDSRSVLRSVAISLRGAQWIVAVGEYETIAIWRLPPK